MPREIVYCDYCGRMIPPVELDSGEAIRTPAAAVCAACVYRLPPTEREAGPRERLSPARGSRRRPDHDVLPTEPRRLSSARLKSHSAPKSGVALGLLAAGTLAGALMAVFLTGSEEPARTADSSPQDGIAARAKNSKGTGHLDGREVRGTSASPVPAGRAEIRGGPRTPQPLPPDVARTTRPARLASPKSGREPARSVIERRLDDDRRTRAPDDPAPAEGKIETGAGPPEENLQRRVDDVRVAEPAATVETAGGKATAGERGGDEVARAPTSESPPQARTRATPVEPPGNERPPGDAASGDAPRGVALLLCADFDEAADGFTGGARVTDDTFGNSPGAFKAHRKTGDEYFAADVRIDVWGGGKSKEKGVFQLQDDTKLTFAYRLEGADAICLQYWNTGKAQNFYKNSPAQRGMWAVMQADLMSFAGRVRRGERSEPGDWVKELKFLAGKPGKEITFLLDDVIVHAGEFPAGAGGALAERIALARAMTADPKRDGYFLTAAVHGHLARRYDEARVTPRRLAAMGGAAAASKSFDSSLKEELRKDEGYTFATRRGLAARGATAAALRRTFERVLDREKPEVVRICFDGADLARGRTGAEVEADLGYIVEKILERGAVPVLYTLPVPTMRDQRGRVLVQDHNKMVMALAAGKEVPCVDAFGILNRDPAALRNYFSRTGSLKKAGFEALNYRFTRLYRVLEYAVMGRDVEIPRAPEARRVAKAARPSPPKSGAAGPGKSAGEGGPARAGDLLRNGGFEVIDDRTGFAKHWRSHQWGEEGVRCSMRIDRANPHSGEGALVVKAFGDGAKPGAYATLSLPAGRYELSYWARAAFDETARVGAHLAGNDLAVNTVGDEWREFRHAVEVPERSVGAALRLWTTTGMVRVWFDDVEVRAVP